MAELLPKAILERARIADQWSYPDPYHSHRSVMPSRSPRKKKLAKSEPNPRWGWDRKLGFEEEAREMIKHRWPEFFKEPTERTDKKDVHVWGSDVYRWTVQPRDHHTRSRSSDLTFHKMMVYHGGSSLCDCPYWGHEG